MEITNEIVESLRERVRPYLKDKRYLHTLGVEREAESLGKIYLPDKVNKLKAASLLHDITKKLSTEEHIKILLEAGFTVTEEEKLSPKLFHSKTGAITAGKDFSDIADEEIIRAVERHTAGHPEMTLFEIIIYLADYIEDTRTFPDCIKLREYFYEHIEKAKTEEEKMTVLYKTMVKSFDMTIECLIEEKGLIDRNTVEARNRFLGELKENE